MRKRKVHIRVVGRLDAAPASTVTIDCAAGLIAVRPLRRRRCYELPLHAVAEMIVVRVVRAELAEKQRQRGRRKLARRGRL